MNYDDLSDETEDTTEGTKLRITTARAVKNNYSVYLYECLDEPADYAPLQSLFRKATANDTITLYINSPGGSIWICQQILNAMSNCKAKLITVADGIVASCATFIFLHGDEYIVNDYSEFMAHTYSTFVFGKGHEVADRSRFREKEWGRFVKKFYKDFLTKKEIKKLINGKDYWLGAKEIKERLKGYTPPKTTAKAKPTTKEKKPATKEKKPATK